MERRPENILVVDDEAGIREAIGDFLATKKYPCECVENAESALQVLEGRLFDIVITDMKMPGMDGIALSKRIKDISPETSIIIITAHGNIPSALEAIQFGAEDYILKPFNIKALEHSIAKVIEKKRLQQQNIDYQQELEHKVEERAKEIRTTSMDIGQTFFKTIHIFGNALESRERYLKGRTERITLLAYHTAVEMGWDSRILAQLLLGAPVSDIGKLALSEDLLYKETPLSEKEQAVIRSHVEEGLDIVANLAHFRNISAIIHFHHERVDGSGYPLGLKGDAIPEQARLVAICDSYDAMTHARPWRPAKPAARAMEEIIALAGSSYDPEIAEAFARTVREHKLDLLIGKKPTELFYEVTLPILASSDTWPE
ncbi:MAG TPA: HD domain-containing phosphohydrolase [Acidobacteriota bacterium]|nr:HD domain-containing phosphohydrolase [Acidobacteriota bacterium]